MQDGEGEEGEEEGIQVGQAGWGLEKECRVIGRRLELAAFYATRRHLPPFLETCGSVSVSEDSACPNWKRLRLVWRLAGLCTKLSVIKSKFALIFFPCEKPALITLCNFVVITSVDR